ncbi:MAG: hypothetical protein Q9P90_17305 [candidate division KSB1 bacterium]|nr:hypothetical protein [candidate division KSB1 bacterium]
MHGVTHLEKQPQPRLDGQPVPVAVRIDRFAFHILHGEIGLAIAGEATVEHPGDIVML